MRLKQKIWVTWSAGAPFTANMGDSTSILQLQAALFFEYLNDEQNKNLYCYFRSNPIQRKYRKRIIEIWVELARFMTTNQRLADQVRTIINKSWFSELEILEIHKQIYSETCQHTTTIVTETLNTEMPETSKQRQTLSNDTTHNILWNKH